MGVEVNCAKTEECVGYPCQFAVFKQKEDLVVCTRRGVYGDKLRMLKSTPIEKRTGDYQVALSEAEEQFRVPCFMRTREEAVVCGASLDRDNKPVSMNVTLSHQPYGTGYKRALDLTFILKSL